MIYSIIPTTLAMLPTCINTSLYTIKDLLILDATSNILGYLKPLTRTFLKYNSLNQSSNIVLQQSTNMISSSASIAMFGVSFVSLGILIDKIDALDSKITTLATEIKDVQKVVNRISSHQNSLENAQFKTPFDNLQSTIYMKNFDTKKQILINCKTDLLNQINFYNDLLSSTDFWKISEVPLKELEIAYQRYTASIFASIYVDVFLSEIEVAVTSCNQYIQDTKSLEQKLDLKNIFINRTSLQVSDDQLYKIQIDQLKKVKEIQKNMQSKLTFMKNEVSFLKYLEEKGENIDHFYQKTHEIEQQTSHEILVIKREKG